jgi:hypothetical protein
MLTMWSWQFRRGYACCDESRWSCWSFACIACTRQWRDTNRNLTFPRYDVSFLGPWQIWLTIKKPLRTMIFLP